MRVDSVLIPVLSILLSAVAAAEGPSYPSPFDVVVTADGAQLLVSDRTAGVLRFVDVESGKVTSNLPLRGEPTGLALSSDGRTLFASEYDAGTVAEIDLATREVRRRLKVGLRPMGLALAAKSGRLVVANTVTNDVSIVDLGSGETVASVLVPREPYFLTVTPDETLAVVGNLLPRGSPSSADYATVLSLIRLQDRGDERAFTAENVRLPPGSTSLRQVRVSSDGRWAYAVHTLGRFQVPATQLEHGWVSTNALSMIDLARRERYATVLLDRLNAGASDPWGLALSRSGERLWITLRGVHELVDVDLGELHRLLSGSALGSPVPDPLANSGAGFSSYTRRERSIWDRIREDPLARLELKDDLSALHQAGVIRRYPIAGRGPRGLALSPDERFLVSANYYSSDLSVIEVENPANIRTIAIAGTGAGALGSDPDTVRLGEQLFHDATVSFQGWLSCSTCHPDRGRNDGLYWDLLNDGLGTPQMTRSLLKSYLVAPTTARGVRADFKSSVTAGFRFLHTTADPERLAAIMAYLSSLEPERSPYLAADGSLTSAQARGKELFEGKGRCQSCHSGSLRTDLQRHEIGTASEIEVGGRGFYTPRLLELYRTAPFLHDGRAANLRAIFTDHDKEAAHGRASQLDERELDDLIQYLLTF